MYNPLCLYFQVSIISRETLSEDEKSLLLSKNDDSAEESEAELIPCNDCTECAAAGDNEYFFQMLKFGHLAFFLVVETNLINIRADNYFPSNTSHPDILLNYVLNQ